MLHRHLLDGRFVSAPEPRLSPYALVGVAILRVGGVSSSLLYEARKPHTNFASPNIIMQPRPIKILETLFCCALIMDVNGMARFMSKRVILVTGTPCVGKTLVARLLTCELDAFYVNLTELALHDNLISGRDEERGSIIVDENRIRCRIREIIEDCDKSDVVIDGHYAVSVVSKELTTYVFVLRRDPVELRKFMEQCGFSGRKLWENLASEILDVCLVDALNIHGEGIVCELDASGKSVQEIVGEILDVLNGSRKCRVGVVDWLGKLDGEGLLGEFLRI